MRMIEMVVPAGHAPGAEFSMMLDREGRIVDVGESLLHLLEPGAEFRGTSLGRIVHPDDRPGVSLLTRATGELIPIRIRDAEGFWQSFDAQAELWIGRTDAVLVRLRSRGADDAREALVVKRHQMQAVSSLVGRIAHEFNNLFTLIQGGVWRLSEAVGPDGDAAAELEAMRGPIEAASGLTRHLLAYSRQQVLEPRVVDLNRVTGDLLPTLREILGEGVELLLLREPMPAKVRADSDQLEQILENLAENSRAAMPAGGIFTVEISDAMIDVAEAERYPYPVAPGRYVRLTVSDTGTGMIPEVLERVFEPFFTTRAAEGRVGLGLSSAYGIVKQTGGYLWVESEPGIGTAVSIYLPWAEGDIADSIDAPALPALRDRGPATILVVEDNPGVRSMVVKLLLRRGFSVIEAVDGGEALRIASEYPAEINLLLTDVMMPHMDGRDLVRTLRESRPEMRVLYMSGFAQKASMRTDFIDSGDSFLSKPFEPEALVAKVRDVLAHLPVRVRPRPALD